MERYSRNILVKEIGEEGQKKLFSASILVCGAGGLGSTVIANLAALGIGKIGILDKDVVEESNLNRQYIHKNKNTGKSKADSASEWVAEFNPSTKIEKFELNLDKNNYQEIISGYNLILDCFDSYESKFLLNEIAVLENLPLIHAGVTEFYGQVTTIIPPKTACLECILNNTDTENYVPKGVISPVVSAIASIQTLEAVKYLLQIGTSLENKLLTVNFLTNEFKTINIAKNPECKLCS